MRFADRLGTWIVGPCPACGQTGSHAKHCPVRAALLRVERIATTDDTRMAIHRLVRALLGHARSRATPRTPDRHWFIYHTNGAWLRVTIEGCGHRFERSKENATPFDSRDDADREMQRLSAGGNDMTLFQVRAFVSTEVAP